MENLSANDQNIFREKGRTFRGTFKIPLDKLQHEDRRDNIRQFDEENVIRLVNVFRAEGCLRHDAENHVEGLISRFSLPEGLARANAAPDGLFAEPPLFNPEQGVTYLQGRHRLEAARRFLIGDDQWWIVDLYSKGQNILYQSLLSLTAIQTSPLR